MQRVQHLVGAAVRAAVVVFLLTGVILAVIIPILLELHVPIADWMVAPIWVIVVLLSVVITRKYYREDPVEKHDKDTLPFLI